MFTHPETSISKANPYDQLPYRSQPIEWTAPERLALASWLHGGPLPDLGEYRVLELGCGDGSNLLPLAFYRPQAQWIGVDGAASAIALACSRQRQVGVANLQFIQCDFRQLDAGLQGQFDFILLHGVISWVPDEVRDALLQLCQSRLKDNGLVYLNYNTRPGWNVRGLVRDYLLGRVDHSLPLPEQGRLAQQAAALIAGALAGDTHPYSQLLANEFRFVCDNHVSYVAHEFLAPCNRAYWRSEFMSLAAQFGLHHVADADFNYPSGRIDQALPARLEQDNLVSGSLDDTVDLVSYRQLHTPLLAKRPPQPDWKPDIQGLHLASCLQALDLSRAGSYRHPNGYEVDVTDPALAAALDRLAPCWPAAEPLAALLDNPDQHRDDLLLLHRHGLIELRLPQAPTARDSNPLNALELEWGGYYTNAVHQRMEEQ